MITVQSTADSKDLEADVDADIAEFDTWFQNLGGGNDPIVRGEKAIIKTWLWYKLKGVKKDVAEASR